MLPTPHSPFPNHLENLLLVLFQQQCSRITVHVSPLLRWFTLFKTLQLFGCKNVKGKLGILVKIVKC